LKVLITSNDSRVRVYDIRTKEIERKYRGYSNQSSQIRGTFSHDDRYIIRYIIIFSSYLISCFVFSGSEDSWFYIWKTEPDSDGHTASFSAKLTRKQRRYFDRAYERIRGIQY
jgi:WD40 repeat protein